MKQSTKNLYYIVAIFIIAFITLGGLGNIAVQEHFYWIPFFVNIGFYGFIIYKLWKQSKQLEEEGK